MKRRSLWLAVLIVLAVLPLKAQTWTYTSARLWIDDTVLCPGQTIDLGIYCAIYPDDKGDIYPLQNFMFNLLFDTSAIQVETYDWQEQNYTSAGVTYRYSMGTPVMSDYQDALKKGGFTTNYIQGNHQGNEPKDMGKLIVLWNGPMEPSFVPDSTRPMFRVRIKSKAQTQTQALFKQSALAFAKGLGYTNAYYDFTPHMKRIEIPSTELATINVPYLVGGTFRAGKGPDKALVSAGPDSVVCVGTRVVLNAEGGVAYRWSQVYNEAYSGKYTISGCQSGYMPEGDFRFMDTRNPVFTPSQGDKLYKLQVEAFGENGCSTRDTVWYMVGKNYLKHLQTGEYMVGVTPEWSFIDSSSSVLLNVWGVEEPSWADMQNQPYYIDVTLSPDSIFPPGSSTFRLNAAQPEYIVSTYPLSDPEFIVARYDDNRHCQAEASASVYIKGLELSGRLNPFPVYRCGTEKTDKSIQLNVVTRGGSGKFAYAWHAKDLEFGEAGKPVIDQPYTRSPRLTYQGLCEVSVDIYDLETGASVTVRDTMQYREWLHPTVQIILDTDFMGISAGDIFCENADLTYQAIGTHTGDSTVYEWQVNGLRVASTLTPRYTGHFRKGDSISVVMYSDEECVADPAVPSFNKLSPNILYPVTLSAYASNYSNGEYLEDCNDTMQMGLLYYNAGNNFHLEWIRNESEVVYSEDVHVENAEQGLYKVNLPRTGFYDRYQARISNSDMPCLEYRDEHLSDYIYINWVNDPELKDRGDIGDKDGLVYRGYKYHPSQDIQPGSITMEGGAVCPADPFTLKINDIKNLPEKFALVWFKKTGSDSVPLGYYFYNEGESEEERPAVLNDFSDEISLLVDPFLDGFNYGYGQTAVRDMIRDGFKLTLNDPTDPDDPAVPVRVNNVHAGDTLYYCVYAFDDPCGKPDYSVRSEYFVPALIENADFRSNKLTVRQINGHKVCQGVPLVLTARVEGVSDTMARNIHYEWYAFGDRITDPTTYYSRYFSFRGPHNDTLICEYAYSHVVVYCEATMDIGGCMAPGSFPKRDTVKFSDWSYHVLKDGKAQEFPFKVTHSQNSFACKDDTVHHWVRAEFYDGRDVMAERETTEVQSRAEDRKAARAAKKTAAALAAQQASIIYEWSLSLEDLKNNIEGSVTVSPDGDYHYVPAVTGHDSTGIGDRDDTYGISTVYFRVSVPNTEGCEVYDSVQVMVTHPYEINASIDLLYSQPWCDTADKANMDFSRKIEKSYYIPGAQYAMLRHTVPNPDKVSWQWYLNGKAISAASTMDTLCLMNIPAKGDELKVIVRNSQFTCRSRVDTAKLTLNKVSPYTLRLRAAESVAVGDSALMLAAVTEGSAAGYVTDAHFDWYKRSDNGDWIPVPGDDGQSVGRFGLDTVWAKADETGAFYKVVVQDKERACPALSSEITIPVAVETGVKLKLVSTADTLKQIRAFCPSQTEYISFEELYTESEAVPVGQGYVYVIPQPKNVSGKAYMLYYKNNTLVAMQPATEAARSLMPDPTTVSFRILQPDEKFYDLPVPGDRYSVTYYHDTLSKDNIRSHSASQSMAIVKGDGDFKVFTGDEVVCAGGQIGLKALFTKPSALTTERSITWSAAPSTASIVSADAVFNDTARATGTLERESVFTAVARDVWGCARTDSVRVFVSVDGWRVPFSLSSPDTVICGDEASVLLVSSLKEGGSNIGNVFKQIYYYVADEQGRVVSVDSGYIWPYVKVRSGYKAYATARLNVDCNYLLSYSDTVSFRSVPAPVLTRVSPGTIDTVMCSGQVLNVKYEVEPADAVMQWNSYLPPVSKADLDARLERNYRVDRTADIVVTASRSDLASCRAQQTLKVAESRYDNIEPNLLLAAGKTWVCGEEEIQFTLNSIYCDSVAWYINGAEVQKGQPVLRYTPTLTGVGGPADTVCVLGILNPTECQGRMEKWSNKVAVRRVEKPVLTLAFRDTAAERGAEIELQAEASVSDGEPAVISWYRNGRNYVDMGNSVSVIVKDDVFYRAVARQEEVIEHIATCFSGDTVWVREKKNTPGPDPVTVKVPAPVFSVASGALFSQDTTVVIGCDSARAEIYYQTGKTAAEAGFAAIEPPALRYTSPLHLTDTTYIRAVSMLPGQDTSAVVTAVYYLRPVSHDTDTVSPGPDPVTVKVPAPVFSVASGALFSQDTTVVIGCDSARAQIYYQTGKTAAEAGFAAIEPPALRYTSPLHLTDTTYIRAVSMLPGQDTSEAVTAVYYLRPLQVDTPDNPCPQPWPEDMRPAVSLRASAKALCEEREVIYMLSVSNCDEVVWMVNGEQTTVNSLTWERVPNLTGFEGPYDTVYAYGIRRADDCHPADTAYSLPAVVMRTEPPRITYITPDTTVEEGGEVELFVETSVYDGSAPLIRWYEDGSAPTEGNNLWMEMNESASFYVRVEQQEAQKLFDNCYTVDSVRVTVNHPTPPPTDTIVFVNDVYVPNTIIPSSSVPADRYLCVYGEDISEVHMQVFDNKGTCLFDARGKGAKLEGGRVSSGALTWKAVDAFGYDVPAGIYTYKVKAFMRSGVQVDKQGWFSVVR